MKKNFLNFVNRSRRHEKADAFTDVENPPKRPLAQPKELRRSAMGILEFFYSEFTLLRAGTSRGPISTAVFALPAGDHRVFGAWKLKFLWSLDFGVWNFVHRALPQLLLFSVLAVASA